MKWKTLTEDAFPHITEKKNIVDDCTIKFATFTAHTITYRSKAVYIIAIDREHIPTAYCNCCEPMIDDKHFIRMFHAEHTVTIDTETKEIKQETKSFYTPDGKDDITIFIDDENIRYCKYKMVEIEDITD